MAREANELCTVQRDDEQFEKLKRRIKRHKPDYLTTLGRVSRQTFYKYLRRIPINQTKEDAIVELVNKADQIKEEADKARLNAVIEMAEAY